MTLMETYIHDVAVKQRAFLDALAVLRVLTGRNLSEDADYSEVEEVDIDEGVYDADSD